MKNSIIFNVNEINKVNFTEVIQSPQNLVYSVNKDMTYVTWEMVDTPSFVFKMETFVGPLSESQLLQNIERKEWLIMID